MKIDPASIGVGLYQHDVKAKHLRTSLDAVVESCVNYVAVDLNTASPALLHYVSGLNQLTARRVYDYRSEHGPFSTREQLKQVPGFGEATFVQSAGFLKIAGGSNPLDATWIHPESYPVAEQARCVPASRACRRRSGCAASWAGSLSTRASTRSGRPSRAPEPRAGKPRAWPTPPTASYEQQAGARRCGWAVRT